MDNQTKLFQQFENSLLSYDAEAAVKTAQAIVDAGIDTMRLSTSPRRPSTDRGPLPEWRGLSARVHAGGRNHEASMVVCSAPSGPGGRCREAGKVVIAAVAGDIHDIGKNLVGTHLSLKGSKCRSGRQCFADGIVDRAEHEKAKIIALSALMTTSMPYQRDVINILKEMGLRQKYFVIIGGGPVTPEFAVEAGADGWAANAVRRADCARAWRKAA